MMAAGALFGVWFGSVYAFVGVMIGSSIAFGIARRAGRGHLMARIARNRRLTAVSTAVASPRVIFLLRLSPVFPTNLLNYALGLSRVSFRECFVGTIGIIPAVFLYVYWGQVIGDLTLLTAGVTPPRSPSYYAMLGVGFLATVVASVLVTRTARRVLAWSEHGLGAEGRSGLSG